MQGGWSSAFARAAEVFRTEGARSLYFKVLGETVYRRLRLLEKEVSALPAAGLCQLDVACRQLEPEEVGAYLQFRPGSEREETLRRLSAGHLCTAVWHEGSIIHAGWAGLGRCWIEYLDIYVDMSPDAAYVYEVWTAPEYRGRRVSSARWEHMGAWLLERGVRWEVGAVWPENQAVLRSSARGGYRNVGMIGYWGVGPLRWNFCRYDGAEPTIRLAQ